MVVNGNLVVKGETVTELQKTLEVDDNLIVTRANSTETPDTPTGLLINIKSEFDKEGNRISNSSMGIVYNPMTQSVDLGLGELEETESNNKLNITESNPIVIRTDSS
jgi:hypothetical protein